MESNPLTQSGYEGYVRTLGEENTLSVKVTGVHCAGCIQKIESRLNDNDDVTNARLNFTTGQLTMTWHGNHARADEFVRQVQSLGYKVFPLQEGDSAQQDENRFLLLCLGVSGFAAGNIMLLSFGLWITNAETMGFATREFLHWISALIAIPTIIFSGRPFFRSAWSVLKNGHTNMDVPISLALILATGMSVHELLRNAQHVYFDSALMLCFFLLIGRYLDFRARSNARSAATDLMSTLQGFANIIDGKTIRKIPIRDVKAGMIVQVAVGEKIPVDGIVTKGESSLDTSLVTGETLPRDVTKGDVVYAGTLNLSAPLSVMVEKAADDSLLADIVRLMDQAGQSQAAYTRLADRAARLYTPVVHTFALIAFVLWWGIIGIDWQDALMIAVTVLIITCPCALGLAVPVAQVLATSRLMKRNILVKSGDALERLAVIDMILMDKTGTLTKGHPVLIGDYKKQDLQLAASLAQHSNHPLSQAIANAFANAFDGDFAAMTDVKEISGSGLIGQWNGKTVRLGSAKWLGVKDGSIDGSTVWMDIDGGHSVCFILQDQLKDDAKEVIDRLKQNFKVALLSGDRQAVVDQIASDVGIDTALGGMTPPQKFDYMNEQKSKGHKILMVGDGLNDAPVLAGADVSMAPGTAIDMAQNAADIVFMGDRFMPVKTAIDMARKTQRIIKENFVIAIVYNALAIPLAFMGMVTPMIAAIAMSGSSLVVIFNSFRIRLKS